MNKVFFRYKNELSIYYLYYMLLGKRNYNFNKKINENIISDLYMTFGRDSLIGWSTMFHSCHSNNFWVQVEVYNTVLLFVKSLSSLW
jgi:hypothetical protein